jgi:signal peptidase
LDFSMNIDSEGTAFGPVAQSPAAGSPTRRKPLSRVGRLAGRAVTVLLAVFVVAAAAATLGPLLLPYRTYAVLSGSMAPAIPVGSLVIDLPVAADQLHGGDVVSFRRPDAAGQVITHRIVQVDSQGAGNPAFLQTKGDANNAPDPWTVSTGPDNWRVAAVIPGAGYVLGYLRSPLGQILTFVGPALLLGVMLLGDLWRRLPEETERPA